VRRTRLARTNTFRKPQTLIADIANNNALSLASLPPALTGSAQTPTLRKFRDTFIPTKQPFNSGRDGLCHAQARLSYSWNRSILRHTT
jgi:hypothetical protein